MSSFFEFGKTTIKVPNKMIFVNKQGYDNLTNPITKSGAIASRFGIKSLNVEPTEGNKIELIESAPREVKPKPKAQRKPQQKKVNVKKEAEDLLSEMMGTKTSKKIEMPELPEFPKEKKVKKEKIKKMTPSEEYQYYKKKAEELTDEERSKMNAERKKANDRMREIRKLKSKKAELEREELYKITLDPLYGAVKTYIEEEAVRKGEEARDRRMALRAEKNKVKKPEPEPRDNIINEWESDTIPILLSQQDPEVYNNIEKKVNQLNKKNQYIVLNELGFYIEKYIDDLFKHYGENKKAVEIIINGLETIAQYIGANNINGYKYDGLLKWFNASNRQKVYKLYNGGNASVTITNKKK